MANSGVVYAGNEFSTKHSPTPDGIKLKAISQIVE